MLLKLYELVDWILPVVFESPKSNEEASVVSQLHIERYKRVLCEQDRMYKITGTKCVGANRNNQIHDREAEKLGMWNFCPVEIFGAHLRRWVDRIQIWIYELYVHSAHFNFLNFIDQLKMIINIILILSTSM